VKFVLSTKIAKAIKDDAFIGGIIYGAQRLGKSSYAAQVMYEFYEDWGAVNEHILFRLEDVVAMLQDSLKARRKIPVLCWDDAGIHANKLIYFSERRYVQYLSNLLDVVGLYLGALLITTPSPMNLLAAIRGYEFYRLKVYRRDAYNGRFAVGYQSVLLPSGTRIIKREFKDNYNVRLPDEFWTQYLVKRETYLDEGLRKLQGIIAEHNIAIGELERTPGEAAVSGHTGQRGTRGRALDLALVSPNKRRGGVGW